jgi:hypothetical protein
MRPYIPAHGHLVWEIDKIVHRGDATRALRGDQCRALRAMKLKHGTEYGVVDSQMRLPPDCSGPLLGVVQPGYAGSRIVDLLYSV